MHCRRPLILTTVVAAAAMFVAGCGGGSSGRRSAALRPTTAGKTPRSGTTRHPILTPTLSQIRRASRAMTFPLFDPTHAGSLVFFEGWTD